MRPTFANSVLAVALLFSGDPSDMRRLLMQPPIDANLCPDVRCQGRAPRAAQRSETLDSGLPGKSAGPAGAAETLSAARAQLRALDEVFRREVSETGVVGAALMVVRGSKILLSSYVGLADRERNIPASPDTIWHWASITKTFTGVTIMQLRDRGRLSLDDPIVKYVPELAAVHDPFGSVSEIKLRHLMTHSAGFRSATFPWGGDKDWHPAEPTRWEQVAAMLPYTEILFPPGSKYSYSNPGVVFLGRTIEGLMGEDYEITVEKNIFKPLGMTRAYFDHAPYHLAKDVARGYEIEDGKPRPTRANFDSGITVSNGGLNAPIGDLAKWIAFLAGDGPYPVLARASLEEMWTPVLPTGRAGPGTESVGLSFFVEDRDGVRYVGHEGGQNGFISHFFLDPKSKLGYVVVYNTSVSDPTKTWDKNLTRAFDRRLKDLMFTGVFPALRGER